jgi:flavodoxin
MKAVVVYDSYFGNTKTVAEEIGKAIGEDVMVYSVKEFDFDELDNIDLLIVGSPTRAFRPTKLITYLIKVVSKSNNLQSVACFDTRMHITDKEPWVLRKLEKRFGYATDTMVKILSKNKNIKVLDPNWFYVGEAEGPLLDDEIQKAIEWTNGIVNNV